MAEIWRIVEEPGLLRVGWALAHSVWQVAGCAAGLAAGMVMVRGPRGRYVMACSALAMAVALPVATWATMGDAVPSFTSPSAATPLMLPSASGTWPVIEQMTGVPASSVGANSLRWSASTLVAGMALVWAGAVGIMAVMQVGAHLRIAQIKRLGADALAAGVMEKLSRRMGVTRNVRAIVADWFDGPVVVGWIKPVILVPASVVSGISPAELEAIVLHELAHVRRCDYLVNALAVVAETLLFYHPGTWWIASVIRREREYCCDDLAAEACGKPTVYASALTRLEELRVAGSGGLALGAGGGGGAMLATRVRRVLGVPAKAGARTGRSMLATVTVLMVIGVGSACVVKDKLGAAPAAGRTSAGTPAVQVTEQTRDPATGQPYAEERPRSSDEYGKRSEERARSRQAGGRIVPTEARVNKESPREMEERAAQRMERETNAIVRNLSRLDGKGDQEIRQLRAELERLIRSAEQSARIAEQRAEAAAAASADAIERAAEARARLMTESGERSKTLQEKPLRDFMGIPKGQLPRSMTPGAENPFAATRPSGKRQPSGLFIRPGAPLAPNPFAESAKPIPPVPPVPPLNPRVPGMQFRPGNSLRLPSQPPGFRGTKPTTQPGILVQGGDLQSPDILLADHLQVTLDPNDLQAVQPALAEPKRGVWVIGDNRNAWKPTSTDAKGSVPAPGVTKERSPAMYYLSGTKHPGAFMLGDADLTVAQALLAAGVDAENEAATSVVILKDPTGSWKMLPLGDVFKKKAGMRVSPGMMIMVDAAKSADTVNQYFVGGEGTPRPGFYSFHGPTNLLQAIIATGADPAALKEKYVVHTRRTGADSESIKTMKMSDLLLPGALPEIGKGDIVMISSKWVEHKMAAVPGKLPSTETSPTTRPK